MPRTKVFDEQEVLEKAMDLFWKKGFHATSIQDLVDHLGINRASLYDTYGGKKALFDKAFWHYRLTNSQAVRDFLDDREDIKTGLRLLFRTAIEQSVGDQDRKGCFVVNTTSELIPGDRETQKVLLENKELFESIFYKYLRRGVKKGQIPKNKDLKSIAALLFTHYNGLKVVGKVASDPQTLYDSVDTLLSVLD